MNLLFYLEQIGRKLAIPCGKRTLVLTYVKDPEAMKLINRVKKDGFLTCEELYRLQQIVHAVSNIEGDIAELGVYKGGSARIISRYKARKNLHLFDTFEGLQDVAPIDRQAGFEQGQYAASEASVRAYLSEENNIFYHKGRFPDTAREVEDRMFSLVHMDMDLYEPTKLALEFFYDKIMPGGVILSHDYSKAEGIRRAFGEFFEGKMEIPFLVSCNQVMVVKR